MITDTLFFDLDDTLYPSSAGLWEAIRLRMNQYMIEVMRMPADEALALRKFYYETYGTTLRGLQKHFQVDANEFLTYVHDLPLERYLQPDPALRKILLSLPQPRWIFTNADADHARRVLERLELEGGFLGVIDVRALGFACKPERSAFARALELAGASDPRACLLFDDSARNLGGAQAMGWQTALVGEHDPAAGCRAISSLRQLPQAMPELWENAPRA